YIKNFEWSYLLITDGISFLAEYPLTRKNLIFFENLSHYPFNINGNICVKCAYIAHDFNEVTDFVVQAMHGLLKPKSKELDNLIKHLSLKNDVSNLIVNDILESLD